MAKEIKDAFNKLRKYRGIILISLVFVSAVAGFSFLAKAGVQTSSISINTINGISSPFNFVCPTNPLFSPVTVTGSGAGVAPPGQIDQYHVQVDWGDGMVTNGLGSFTPSSGQGPFTFTFQGGPHSYDSGSYTITARLYHQQPPGQDNQADVVISVPVCIVSEPPILTLIKHVINDAIGTLSAGDFNLHVKIGGQDVFNSPAPGSETGTIYTLAPGTFIVSEDPVVGYTQSVSGHCAVDGSITLNSGDFKTCTITNDDIAPECIYDSDCDNDLYCDGAETCDQGVCQSGTDVVCSTYDISAIGTCTNDPDNNPFTWDFRAIFTSQCDEDLDVCTTGDETITHTCDMKCGAGCANNNDCPDTDCNSLDGCQGNDYYDYDNVANSCISGCACTRNQCGGPRISYNSSACTECQTNDDCNDLDQDYCDGTVIKHDEGVCMNYECTTDTSVVIDCDNGLYCDGQEGCSNANCTGGTAVNCSANNIDSIGTCDWDPDDNIFTWDFFAGFISECDEDLDICTTGTINLTHTCDAECDAECVINEDCNEGYTCNTNTCQCVPPGPRCGDGIKNQTSEECDGTDGIGAHQTCSTGCTLINLPYCGDQACNNEENCETCSQDCGQCQVECQPTTEICGNGVDEDCNGSDASCGGGSSAVTTGGGGGGGHLVVCGDGITEWEEQCDDGNKVDGDGCSSICRTELVAGVSTEQQGEVLGEATTRLPETGNSLILNFFALIAGMAAAVGTKRLSVK